VEYNATPFARVALSLALRSIEQGLAPAIVDPGALAAAVPLYIEELGVVDLEADLAAADLFCSDELAQSDGEPFTHLYQVGAPPSKIGDHVHYDDEGRMEFSGLDVQEAFYKVFDTSEVRENVPLKTFIAYLAKNRLFYQDIGDKIFVSNTKSSAYGCPPTLKHLGVEMVRCERVGEPIRKLAAATSWEDAFDAFESDPDSEVVELLTRSVVIRKSFLDIRTESGPLESQLLSGFRDRFLGIERAVSFCELVEALRSEFDSAVKRFMLFMELRGLLRWSFGACHYE
jgi:hypothetical protein